MNFLVFFYLAVFYVNVPGVWSQGVTVNTNCPATSQINSGRITSPNYPSNYEDNQNCYWLLTSTSGAIHISFEAFQTEARYDYVRVYDGSSTSANRIGQFSGSSLPSSLTSSSNQMYITFNSDGSNIYRGFALRYSRSVVTCETTYMEILLYKAYFPTVDWRNLHLIEPTCRANYTQTTITLRTDLNGCGTIHKENNDTIVFENKVMDDKGHVNQSAVITRDSVIVLPFHCNYSRRQVVSTSFNASKETVRASEGSFGNFTFMMNMYKSDAYQAKYTQNEYPVSVALNQMLWIQYKVVNTIGDLVVFAENCRATLSTDPDSTPQYEFLKNGCPQDNTMDYNYDPSSSVQQFSIKSFRFLHTNNRLVYLHCHLMVCHRNSANSRCSRGCIGSRRRRRRGADDYDDTSKQYDLSTGPITGEKIDTSETDQNKGSDDKVQGMAIGLGVLGGVLVVIGVAVILKCISAKVLKSRKIGSTAANAAKSNDEVAAAHSDMSPPKYAFDGPGAFELNEGC